MPSPEADAFRALIHWLPYNPVLGSREVHKVTPPEHPLDLEGWKKEIGEQFPEYVHAAEVCLSVLCQLVVQDVRNPFPLVVVDRASSGKTILLNFFSDLEGISFTLDQFTPASFVTHIAARSKKQLEEIDLLPAIRLKTLIVREMGTIFGEDEDALRQKIGLLTRIFDGEGYKDWSGVYGKRGYSGDYNFMFLGASTPFPLRVWKTMTQFGHRFFFLNLRTKVKGDDELLLQMRGQSYKVKEALCRLATERLVRTIWSRSQDAVVWNKDLDEVEALKWIAKLAVFVASFRGDIIAFDEWTENGKEITTNAPAIEDPSRICACFCNLALGHAVAAGRNYITMDDLGPVIRVATSTAPSPRPEMFRALLQAAGPMTAEEISKVLNVSLKTAKKEMHKFLKVGLAEGSVEQDTKELDDGSVVAYGQKRSQIDLHPQFRWWREDAMVGLLERFGIIF